MSLRASHFCPPSLYPHIKELQDSIALENGRISTVHIEEKKLILSIYLPKLSAKEKVNNLKYVNAFWAFVSKNLVKHNVKLLSISTDSAVFEFSLETTNETATQVSRALLALLKQDAYKKEAPRTFKNWEPVEAKLILSFGTVILSTISMLDRVSVFCWGTSSRKS